MTDENTNILIDDEDDNIVEHVEHINTREDPVPESLKSIFNNK
jgi:hypothetical protein